MMTIRLPLVSIFSADPYKGDLPIIDTFTQEDADDYEETGTWNDYRPDDYLKKCLPELGEPRYFSSYNTPVIPLAGRKFKVSVECLDCDEPWEAEGKTLILEETDEPETEPDRDGPKRWQRGGYYWKFFGQPVWVQGAFYPAGPDGEPCRHLVTIENGWGDCGNWNILVSLDEDGLPSIAYFEASCC